MKFGQAYIWTDFGQNAVSFDNIAARVTIPVHKTDHHYHFLSGVFKDQFYLPQQGKGHNSRGLTLYIYLLYIVSGETDNK